MAGGLRIATITAIVVSLLAPLVVVAGLTPITGAALMAIMTMTVGRLSTFGLHRATMLVPILMAWPMLAPVRWQPHDRIDELNALLAKHGTSLADALTTMKAKPGSSPGQGSSSGDAMGHLLVELRMDSTYLTTSPCSRLAPPTASSTTRSCPTGVLHRGHPGSQAGGGGVRNGLAAGMRAECRCLHPVSQELGGDHGNEWPRRRRTGRATR